MGCMSSWKSAFRQLLKWSEKQHKQVNSLSSISQSGWIYLELKTMNENEKHDEWQPSWIGGGTSWGARSNTTDEGIALNQMEPSSTTK